MYKNVFSKLLLFFSVLLLLTSCGQFKPLRPAEKKETPEYRTRDKLVDFSKKQIGIKYMYGGKTTKGFDCSGFTAYVFEKQNIKLSPSSKIQASQGKRIPLPTVQAGDLIFFSKNKRDGKVSHVAMVVSNTKEGISVIHSTSSKGVRIDNISQSNYWKPRILYARTVL